MMELVRVMDTDRMTVPKNRGTVGRLSQPPWRKSSLSGNLSFKSYARGNSDNREAGFSLSIRPQDGKLCKLARDTRQGVIFDERNYARVASSAPSVMYLRLE